MARLYAALAGLIWLAIALGYAQDAASPALPPGHVQSVTCAANAAQSYELYLPAAYAPAKHWPIMYFFDPGGRGRYPIELYKDVAEKYGFIIAGSNNSRNFGGDVSTAINALWLDTHQRLAIDDRRTYASGFSGGARVAGAMAFGCPPCHIAGVIASGAGYPGNFAQASNKDKVLYFFAVGDQDFNWPEVMTIRNQREESGLPYRVRVFPGPHQWALAPVMDEAIAWLTLKGMQSGDVPKDSSFIDRLFQERQVEATVAEKNADAVAQSGAYRSLVSDFAGLKDSREFTEKLATLKQSAALKNALKKEQDQVAEQSRLEQEASSRMRPYLENTADDPISLHNDILQSLKRLSDAADHAKQESQRLVSRRALDDIWVAWIETGQQELESRHYQKAEACFELMSEVRDDPWPVLLLAETYAAAGNKKLGIRNLQEAVKRGLKNRSAVESNERLQLLRTEPEFQKIIDTLQPAP